MRAASREALGLFLGGMGGLGFLVGFSPLINVLPTFGWIFGLMLVAGALLFVIAELRRNRSFVGAFVELTLFGVLAFGSVFGTMWYFTTYLPANGGFEINLETSNTVRNDFLSELKIGNFDKAYEFLSPDAKNQIPDSTTLGKLIKENNWQPTKWSWTSEQTDDQHAQFGGEATYIDKRQGKIQLWLDKIDKHWKVSSMNFQPQ